MSGEANALLRSVEVWVLSAVVVLYFQREGIRRGRGNKRNEDGMDDGCSEPTVPAVSYCLNVQAMLAPAKMPCGGETALAMGAQCTPSLQDRFQPTNDEPGGRSLDDGAGSPTGSNPLPSVNESVISTR